MPAVIHSPEIQKLILSKIQNDLLQNKIILLHREYIIRSCQPKISKGKR